MITIQPSGRFGNNIQQFIHAIYIAEKKHIPFIKYTFPQFKKTTLRIRFNELDDMNFSKMTDTFYNIHDIVSFEDKQRIACSYLLPLLKYTSPTGYEQHYSTGLFVHIRSGDIFKSSNPHPNYAQPPLVYYETIFALEPNRQIFVFYEDDLNPVVNALREKYSCAKFSSISLGELISIFMNARHIVNNVGTLIQGISYFNRNIQTFYATTEVVPNTTIISLPNYITEWKNTEEQRQFMLDYTIA